MTVKDQLKILDRKIKQLRLIMICIDKMNKYLLYLVEI